MSNRAKILFVDEDPATLYALQILLRDEDWDCFFASTGSEALVYLAEERIDLLVTAAVMAQMDGNKLLKEVRRRYPSVVRIFLTGHPRHETVCHALAEGQTQQIIPKPWIDQELKEILRSALRQAAYQRKYSPEFQQLINSIPLLPALPETYSNVHACIADDEIDIEKMAGAISQDVALSSLLLHWGNSALFGQRFLVDSIKKAIIVLGTDIVESLVLSESVNRAVSVSKVRGFDIHHLKKHSIATATCSRLLIKTAYSSNVGMQDRAFIAGLLHDMGKLLLAVYLPEQFQQAINLASEQRIPLEEAEQSTYGTDHAEIGAALAEWWSLPPFLMNAIRFHHHPHRAPTEPEVVAATYVANILSCRFSLGFHSDIPEREIDQTYRDRFYLNEETVELLRAKTLKTISELPI